MPTVFRGTPSHYRVIKPDELKEWEKRTTESLGLEVAYDAAASGALATISFCGITKDGYLDDCDSDVLPQ
jgi:hypothetical protein